MILYGLRLLVALLTFAVGVAAAWLLDYKSAPACRRAVEREVRTVAIEVPDPSLNAPPRRSCSFEKRRIVAGGIINGKAISKPLPVYPQDAKDARVSGTVVVTVVVDESGRVESAEAVSGPELLRDAAEEAARQAQFSPTRLSGEPVKVSGTITYNFVLQ